MLPFPAERSDEDLLGKGERKVVWRMLSPAAYYKHVYMKGKNWGISNQSFENMSLQAAD